MVRFRGLQSRQILATTGTLAILYCIVVLTYVATSPDLRIRCLLLDSTRPSDLPASVQGVVMRKVELAHDGVAPHLPIPADGDILTRMAESPVHSFFDFSHQISNLRRAPLKANGQLPEGADIAELMDVAPELIQDSSMVRWVRLEFYTPSQSADSEEPVSLDQGVVLGLRAPAQVQDCR